MEIDYFRRKSVPLMRRAFFVLYYCIIKMKKIFFILIFLFPFILSTCKKEENTSYADKDPCYGRDTTDTTFIFPSMLDFKYKPGTYWILQDSLTGVTDSVYITTYE